MKEDRPEKNQLNPQFLEQERYLLGIQPTLGLSMEGLSPPITKRKDFIGSGLKRLAIHGESRKRSGTSVRRIELRSMKRRSFTWAQFVSRLLVDDMLSRETRNRHGWTNVSRQLIMVQPFMRRFLYSIPSSGENPFKQRKLGIERDVVSCLYEIASNKNVIQQLRSNFWKTRFVTTSSWDGWYSLCTSHERAWPTREILKQTSANHDSWSAVPVSMARPTRRREWNSAWPWVNSSWLPRSGLSLIHIWRCRRAI